jgi:hypothetical protein
MTFDDDFIQLHTPHGVAKLLCADLMLDWPPPEKLRINNMQFYRESFSQLTDEDRKALTRVCRGAVYKLKLNS